MVVPFQHRLFRMYHRVVTFKKLSFCMIRYFPLNAGVKTGSSYVCSFPSMQLQHATPDVDIALSAAGDAMAVAAGHLRLAL